MICFRQSLLNHFRLQSLSSLLLWSPRCHHLASRSTANAVVPEHLLISGSHPNHSVSLDAGVFRVLPEVVCRFSGRNSFFLQMVVTWFVSCNAVGLQLSRPATRNGSHICHHNGSHICTRARMVTTSLAVSQIQLYFSTSCSPPWFHMCLDVKMCAFKSMKYACLSSYKEVGATHLILPSVLLLC